MNTNNDLQNCLLSNFCNLITVRLDDSNYVTWKFLLETLLKGCGLLQYIDGSFPCPPRHMINAEDEVSSDMTKEYMNWEQNDSAIMSILAATLSSDVLSFVVGSKTSRDIWCQLKEKYASASKSNILYLKTSLYNIQKGSDSIDKYLLRVKLICDQLAAIGVQMDDEDILISVLHGLPSDYATMKTIIRIKQSPVSMQDLRSLLLITEEEIELSAKSINLPSKTAVIAYGDASRDSANSIFGHSCSTHGSDYSATAFTNGLHNSCVPNFWLRGFTSGFTQHGGQRDSFNSVGDRYSHRNIGNYPYWNSNPGCLKSGDSVNNLGCVRSNDFGDSNGCTYFSNGVQHNKSSFDNSDALFGININCVPGTQVTQDRFNSTSQSDSSQSECFPSDVCQICSQFGHFAETCPQRSAPRQVVAYGSSFQCQICFQMGHSAAECLQRHHYDFQPPTYVKSQAMAASFSSQSLPASNATHNLPLPIKNATPVDLLPSRLPTLNVVPPTFKWEPVMVHTFGDLQAPVTWKLSSSPPVQTSLSYRQMYQPVEPWQSLPLIPPG